MMQEDETWHKQILMMQKQHKEILFTLPEGGRIDNMTEDPFISFKRIQEYNAQYSKDKPEEIKAFDIDPNDKDQIEEAKKSYGKFSFLGSEETQKKLVEEFLNRNKKKETEEVKEEENEAKDDQSNEKPKEENNKEEEEPKEGDAQEDDKKEEDHKEDDKKEDEPKQDNDEIDAEKVDKVDGDDAPMVSF